MRIICDTEKFTEVCLNVQRCIPNRSVMPHLEGILIKTTDDGRIELSGFDLDMGITTRMDVRVEQPGAVVLNAKMFCDILRHLREETVYIDCDEKNVCTIKGGEYEYTMISLAPEEYPELPSVAEDTVLRISQKVLKNMIRQTIYAVSVDDSKTVHRGIKFEIAPGSLRLIALDGFRLAIRSEFTAYEGKELSFVVPAKTLSEIVKFIDDEDKEISLSIGRRHIIFEIGDYYIISRLLEGMFLDYRSAVPTAKSTVVRVNTSKMIECIEGASIMVTEKMKSPIKFIFDEDTVKLSTVTALGSFNDKFSASVDGKRTEIGFNNRFVMDALRSCECDEVLINLNGPLAPAVIVPTEGDHFLYLILPVKIKN